MASAEIPMQQLDSRSLAIAAGYEADLAALESVLNSEEAKPEDRLMAIRLKNSTRKDYLAALAAIGGTWLIRKRMGLTQEKQPQTDDPWAKLG